MPGSQNLQICNATKICCRSLLKYVYNKRQNTERHEKDQPGFGFKTARRQNEECFQLVDHIAVSRSSVVCVVSHQEVAWKEPTHYLVTSFSSLLSHKAISISYIPKLRNIGQAMNVHQAQTMAAVVAKDEPAAGSAVGAFASLGGGGSGSHAERDLHRWLGGTVGLGVELKTVTIDLYSSDGAATVPYELPYLAPMDVALALWNSREEAFHQSFIGAGGVAEVAEFWRHHGDAAWVRDHPHVPCGAGRASTIPIWIHGDAGRAFKTQKLLVVTWASALVGGSSWQSRMIFCTIPEEAMIVFFLKFSRSTHAMSHTTILISNSKHWKHENLTEELVSVQEHLEPKE